MTYESANNAILPALDDISIKIYKTILDDYSEAANAVIKEMATMWAGAKNVAPDDMYNYAIQYNRLDKMLDEIEAQYIKYSKLAGEKVADNSFAMINESFYRHQYQLTFFTGSQNVALDFITINPFIVEASVYGTVESWKEINNKAVEKIYGSAGRYMPQNGTLTELLVKNRVEEVAKIRSTISSAIIRGESYKETSNLINNIIGAGRIQRGEVDASGAKYKSLRIARTEGTRNYNAGGYANTQWAKSEGVEVKRQWLATLDGRTRDTHGALDGKFEDENGQWTLTGKKTSYPGQVDGFNCRCTVIDRIEGVEIESRRGKVKYIDENGKETWKSEVFSWTDYATWAGKNGLKQNNNGAFYAPKSKG